MQRAESAAHTPTSSVLQMEHVSFSYNARNTALHDISLHIPAGQIVGLVGPNGSGKSTLIKLVVDLLNPRGGSIRVAGEKQTTRAAKAGSIYLASNDYLPDFLSGREYLDFVHGLYGQRADLTQTSALFERYGMAGREKDLIEDYSHGMRKKVQLIAALMLRRKLTVIDETLNGVDLDALFLFERDVKSLADGNRSVLLCSHDFGMLSRVAHRLLFLDRGILTIDDHVSAIVADYGSIGTMVRDFLDTKNS